MDRCCVSAGSPLWVPEAVDEDAIPVLGFANPHFLPGRNTSIRRGTRWLGVTQVRIALGNGQVSAPLLLHTRACRFDSLGDDELAFEHDPACRSVAGLLVVMQSLYPGFTASEIITICDFRLSIDKTG